MQTRELIINRKTGLHSEIASALCAIAKNTDVPLFISKLNGEASNLLRPLEVIGLGIQPGETVILVMKTPDAAVANQLFALVSRAIG